MAVVGLNKITKEQVDIAGGKGANLGELIQHDFPVPPGFVVTAHEYAKFIDTLTLPGNDDIPDDIDSFLNDIRTQIMAFNLPPHLTQAIEQHHQLLANQRRGDAVYAVRSSATAEDLGDASFAGQHDTYYYVGADELDVKIRQCWASLWSDAAFSYRHTQGIEHRGVHMAVIVQKMILSDVSGVTFTADPVSGSDSVIITESSWGMGAAIVDGRVSPDQYLVDKRSNRLTSIKISDKKFMVPATLEVNQSSRLVEVPANLRRAESLTDDQVEAISTLAARAESHFGNHQDIEWAIQGDDLFMLQSRPITAMGSPDDDLPSGKYVLFKPVAENFTDPLMPLTQDLLSDLVPMMTFIHGRIYVKLSYFRGLLPLKIDDEDLARIAYFSDPKETKLRVSIPKLLILSLVIFGNYLVMGVFNRRVASMPDDFMTSSRARAQRIINDDRVSASQTLFHLFFRFGFFEPAGNMALLANLVAPRYMVFMSMLNRLLKRWAPALPDDASSLLCSGSKGVLSTEMGREILELAKIAKANPTVKHLLQNTPLPDLRAALAATSEASSFNSCLDDFLQMHGHRALKEFELNSIRWEEDPTPVLGMIRNYLIVETNLEDTESKVQTQREALRAQLTANLSGIKLAIIQRLISQTRYYMKLRENSRFYHIMTIYAVRLKVLKVERQLLKRGILKCKDDIFYLHWPEIDDLVNERLTWNDVEDIIRQRRMEHVRLSKMTPPKTIGLDIEDKSAATSADQSGRLLGQGASPGRYEGIARVIMDPATDNEIAPGEILVAPYTDPAWTPLFLTANAAVIEVGSYLSHAGTIAREYGMPCVVDVSNCTSKIKSGTRIIVDGSQGSVVIVKAVEEQTT
jgi:phosphoenolpyruvate synthase/pyruvate phosphate dikinase